MSNNILDQLKSQINFDAPDERLVLRAIYCDTNTNVPRGFLDVFTQEQVVRMFNSDRVWEWSHRNRDWLTQTIDHISK